LVLNPPSPKQTIPPIASSLDKSLCMGNDERAHKKIPLKVDET